MNDLIASIESYKKIDAWRTTPLITEEEFDRLQTIMKDSNELETKVPYDKLINTNFFEAYK